MHAPEYKAVKRRNTSTLLPVVAVPSSPLMAHM